MLVALQLSIHFEMKREEFSVGEVSYTMPNVTAGLKSPPLIL